MLHAWKICGYLMGVPAVMIALLVGGAHAVMEAGLSVWGFQTVTLEGYCDTESQPLFLSIFPCNCVLLVRIVRDAPGGREKR